MAKELRLDRGQIEAVDDLMAGILRGKTAAERIRIGFDMWISTRDFLLAHLRKTHPDWSAEKVNQEVARRLSHGAV
jgi:RNA:NAD 2'-phosphotransferase (TPT1/KptA family)